MTVTPIETPDAEVKNAVPEPRVIDTPVDGGTRTTPTRDKPVRDKAQRDKAQRDRRSAMSAARSCRTAPGR
jgi:hypothetical protein